MKIEMHCHTCEVSPCASASAYDIVKQHKLKGYDAVVITDHFNDYVLESFSGTPEERVTKYLEGYKKALKAGDEFGIKIFFGIETCILGGYEDFLIYGAGTDFLYEHPKFYNYTQEKAYKICKEKGFLFIQAHPNRSYCRPRNPKYIDGIEVFNGNPRYNNNNNKSKLWYKENPHFICTSGSDCHAIKDVNNGGIITDYYINNEEEFKNCILEGNYKLIEK